MPFQQLESNRFLNKMLLRHALPVLSHASISQSCLPSNACNHKFYFSLYFLFLITFFSPASEQSVVTGVVPSSPRFLPSIFIAHRVQLSHCSSIFHRVLLTHAHAFCAGKFVHNKKSPRMYTSMHSSGLEHTKLTYTRLEDNVILNQGDGSTIHRPCRLSV